MRLNEILPLFDEGLLLLNELHEARAVSTDFVYPIIASVYSNHTYGSTNNMCNNSA